MSVSSELMYAILAMDAYNRSYDAGIEGLGGVGSQIGTATITTDSETTAATKDSWQAAGFYAVAYEWEGTSTLCLFGNPFDGLGAQDCVWKMDKKVEHAANFNKAVEFTK